MLDPAPLYTMLQHYDIQVRQQGQELLRLFSTSVVNDLICGMESLYDLHLTALNLDGIDGHGSMMPNSSHCGRGHGCLSSRTADPTAVTTSRHGLWSQHDTVPSMVDGL